jgi:hypothetical protein
VQAGGASAGWLVPAAGEAARRGAAGLRRVAARASGNPTGLSVTWLGTSSGCPTLTRNTSSMALRAGVGEEEAVMLVDCGARPSH